MLAKHNWLTAMLFCGAWRMTVALANQLWRALQPLSLLAVVFVCLKTLNLAADCDETAMFRGVLNRSAVVRITLQLDALWKTM